MTFIAFIVLGLVATTRLPVSLMPDIDIPEITVQIDGKNMPVRKLENGVVRPLRRQLLQVPHLKTIHSETRDENAVIRLKFEYGANVDLAFIDVNEKIDRSMDFIPDALPRPRVIKASASDIPVFYMNVTAKDNYLNTGTSNQHKVSDRFTELSRFTDQVIKKRLEQLGEVAMADISGTISTEIAIIPDKQKLRSLNLDFSDIEHAIQAKNFTLGNIVVKDGVYQYNLRFEQSLKNKHDLQNILLKAGNKTLKLEDIATVRVRPAKRGGLVTSQQKDAISLAVIKKSGARMQDMQQSLHELTRQFRADYPDIEFEILRDQTKLLDYSIHNLGNTLLLGAILAFLIMFIFLRDIRSPLLIGISIPTSLIISVLFFYIFQISINIISLSGLILGIGMMIDNSIIVIDNITQYIDRGNKLSSACVKGTNEVIRPLLSSVLTTCAVFIPLIFISGLAGALFYDQALAVAIGLFTSFFVSITLIPVYYKLVYKPKKKATKKQPASFTVWNYYASYERGLKFVLRKQGLMLGIFLVLIAVTILFYQHIQKERIPQIKHDELFVSIEWNDKIHVTENKRRSLALLEELKPSIEQSSVYAGTQQYLMNLNNPTSPRASKIYIKLKEGITTQQFQQQVDQYFRKHYPRVRYSFQPPENVFELLFSNQKPPLVAHIMPFEKEEGLIYEEVNTLVNEMDKKLENQNFSQVPSEEHIEIALDPGRLKTYEVKRRQVIDKLKTLFSEYQVTEIKSSQQFMPIVLAHTEASMLKLIRQAKVKNQNNRFIPLKELLDLQNSRDFKEIIAGKGGEYFPLAFQTTRDKAPDIQKKMKQVVSEKKGFEIQWNGSLFTSEQMVREILLILLISLLLLYFILASQFESLSLPLIVLLEVPIDIAGALFFLWIFGETINIMSLIGIIVMTGIIINDSILKIDTINRLRKEGMPLTKALIIGGQRRLKPILMTSITTIMAMIPFLFISGMGSDLQRPLAVSVIGGMAVGTFVSLYFIPLFYYLLKRKSSKKQALTA